MSQDVARHTVNKRAEGSGGQAGTALIDAVVNSSKYFLVSIFQIGQTVL
jgi:hypothetical protein